MSATYSPPRPHHDSAPELPDIAEICRARHIVERLGGRFSLELGIDVDRGRHEVERWALAVTLLGDDNLWTCARRTYRVLEDVGVRTIADAGRLDSEQLVRLLDEGAYLRYETSMATRLRELAGVVGDRYAGRLAVLGEHPTDPAELARTLRALPGWSPAIVQAFLRELRGVWAGAEPPLERCVQHAASHVALPCGEEALRSLAESAHVDFRDLEAGLVRLARDHDLASCPGGEECPLAASDHEQLVHF
jgi:hypothetical protein